MLTIYKASAGSGKTFTLAYEYLKMPWATRTPRAATASSHQKEKEDCGATATSLP